MTQCDLPFEDPEDTGFSGFTTEQLLDAARMYQNNQGRVPADLQAHLDSRGIVFQPLIDDICNMNDEDYYGR